MINSIIKEIRIADLILIALLLFAIVFSSIRISDDRAKSTVRIYKNNILWGEFALNDNSIIRIDSHNSIQIKNEKVQMLYADCPDKRCVKQGLTNTIPIICLPNHVLVEIIGKKNDRMLILQ